MFQLRQFHLQLAFAGPGALGEDAQNQLGAVEHLAPEFLFQVALLARGQVVVENHRRRVERVGLAPDLLDLAGAGEEFRIGPGALAAYDPGAQRTRALREAYGFSSAFFVVRIVQIQADEDGCAQVGGPAEGYCGGIVEQKGGKSRGYSPAAAGSMLIGRDGTTVEIACL